MSTIKGRCSVCGWTTKRHLKNMSRPCPKCGGAVYVSEEDRETAMMIAIIGVVAMIAVAVLMVSVGAAKP